MAIVIKKIKDEDRDKYGIIGFQKVGGCCEPIT